MWQWFDSVASLDKTLWSRLLQEQERPSPFLTPAFLEPWLAHYASEQRVGVWDGRGAILLHRVERGWELAGGQDVADRLDALGTGSEFWSSLREEVSEWGEPLAFPNLGPDAQALKFRRDDDHLEVTDQSPYLSLEGKTFESLLSERPKKHRHEIKRKLRKAEGLEWCSGIELLEDFLRLHKLSSPDKQAFMEGRNEAFFRALADRLEQDRMLWLTGLRHGDELVASMFHIRFAGVAHLYNSGYNPEFSSFIPGLNLIVMSTKKALEEGLREYDFLRGTERYKYQLGGVDRPVYRLTWFASG